MKALRIDHSDPEEHRASIMQQMRHFWMDGHLCDVVLKSFDGAEHRAHMAVLSAASVFFKNLLGGPFLEAQRVQQKQPVEIAASKEALCALLDYIYDGQPEVSVEVGLELLRLADAFDLPKLGGEIAACIHAHLDCSVVALQVLQDPYVLDSLRTVSEDKVLEEFEICSQHPYLGKLSASQLTRILTKEDLAISREETVMNAILTWNKFSKDGHGFGMLLQHVHFQALSIENLLRLRATTLSGPNGDDLRQRVEGALSSRKRIQCRGAFEPTRPYLRHWSPFLGASTTSIEGRMVLSLPCTSLCWHQGKLFAASFSRKSSSILSWKPGDPATCVRPVAGEGATVSGINDLGFCGRLSISPSGEIFVADWSNERIVCFENGCGHFLVDVETSALCCSPNGGLYVLSRAGRTLQMWDGSRLQIVLNSESLRADLQFSASRMFVTKKEVLYLLDNRIEAAENKRILCFNPAESLKPVVVGRAPTEGPIFLSDLFVTESGLIYVAEWHQRKLLAFHPGSTTYAEVLQCPHGLHPVALLVQERSLYVSMVKETGGKDPKGPDRPGAVYHFLLPPNLQLE